MVRTIVKYIFCLYKFVSRQTGKVKYTVHSLLFIFLHQVSLPKMTTKGDKELVEVMPSYSDNDSEAQESISEYSEDDISETSEDRAFVVSDGEQSAYSKRSSVSSNYSQHCHVHSNDSYDFVSRLRRSFE